MSRWRIAAAPISWGVCEVPGWGEQLDSELVLSQMGSLGYAATELGPAGFLPEEVEELHTTLGTAGLALAGAFVAPVLHQPELREAAIMQVRACAATLAEVGLDAPVVLACATGADGYEQHAELDDAGWAMLADGITQAQQVCASMNVPIVLHPHVGTMVERADHVDQVMERTTVALCLDTGHLMAAGADPLRVLSTYAARITHVHLKDVDAAMAERVRAGAVSYADAVSAGMYVPIGTGDVPMTSILTTLDQAGFAGWMVVEQDRRLAASPADGSCASGPARDDAAHAHAYLESFDAAAAREVAS